MQVVSVNFFEKDICLTQKENTESGLVRHSRYVRIRFISFGFDSCTRRAR